ncbi:MAG TPA: alpha/beta hydrolase [Acidimicrobiales bacterium]|nr:alpha/beta hydrolase [Acidimicrobiales bacterium]
MSAASEPVEVIRLWPDGPPTVIENVPPETEYVVSWGLADGTLMIRNISDARLNVYAPAPGTANGHGIMVVPGGGWAINAWTHEGTDVATALTALGYTCFVLKYRLQPTSRDQAKFETTMRKLDSIHAGGVKYADKPTAIGDLISTPQYLAARAACADDGRRAIELVRKGAERFGIRADTLGMIGFSAGAFLTVDVALDPRADQVAYIAPIYGGETQGAPVPADAPPLFTAVAQDDILVRIVEGLHADWTAADRPSEVHHFRRGAHGFGMVRQGLPSDGWFDLFTTWVRDLGY